MLERILNGQILGTPSSKAGRVSGTKRRLPIHHRLRSGRYLQVVLSPLLVYSVGIHVTCYSSLSSYPSLPVVGIIYAQTQQIMILYSTNDAQCLGWPYCLFPLRTAPLAAVRRSSPPSELSLGGNIYKDFVPIRETPLSGSTSEVPKIQESKILYGSVGYPAQHDMGWRGAAALVSRYPVALD